jgi:hypothetical protein
MREQGSGVSVVAQAEQNQVKAGGYAPKKAFSSVLYCAAAC